MAKIKQSWMMRHPSVEGARIIEIVRYEDPDKLLNQIFYGSVPDGFEVSFSTADRVELTLDGEVDFYLEPVIPLALTETVEYRLWERPTGTDEDIYGEWSETDPRIEPGWDVWLKSRKVYCKNAGVDARLKTIY